MIRKCVFLLYIRNLVLGDHLWHYLVDVNEQALARLNMLVKLIQEVECMMEIKGHW